ncbi:MAG: hypothetical protein CM1200mP21_01830 [Candidatus Poseidoniales archaeon]|nr:MAG: hypothetical protein CM1200mP21_01830 [Candidatus Poseidoniales archaeon]
MVRYSTSIQKIRSGRRESLRWPRPVGIDPQEALDRIHVARAYNSAHQILLVDEIKRMSKNIDVKLIIVDSLTSHFRAKVHWPRYACTAPAEAE